MPELWRQNWWLKRKLVGGSDAVLVIDDTAIPTKVGIRWVSLRNMDPHSAQTANCQIMVSLTLARGDFPGGAGVAVVLPRVGPATPPLTQSLSHLSEPTQ